MSPHPLDLPISTSSLAPLTPRSHIVVDSNHILIPSSSSSSSSTFWHRSNQQLDVRTQTSTSSILPLSTLQLAPMTSTPSISVFASTPTPSPGPIKFPKKIKQMQHNEMRTPGPKKATAITLPAMIPSAVPMPSSSSSSTSRNNFTDSTQACIRSSHSTFQVKTVDLIEPSTVDFFRSVHQTQASSSSSSSSSPFSIHRRTTEKK